MVHVSRDPGRYPPAGAFPRPRIGPEGILRQQPKTNGDGVQDVRRGSAQEKFPPIFRLDEIYVERLAITDIDSPTASANAQSEVAVMWDQSAAGIMVSGGPDTKPLNHPRGANVLYMDGHVAFANYVPPPNGKLPVTHSTFIGGANFTGID